jgi:hypothetical protein
MSDFSDGGNVFVDVQDAAYIPDDKDILLLNSPGGITVDTTVTTNQDSSITRTWNINQDNGGGFDPLTQLWARSAADYASPLEGTPEYLRGVELNSLRAAANLDPTSDAGILLGALDTFDSLEAYENAIDGVGPTTQVPCSARRSSVATTSSSSERRHRSDFRAVPNTPRPTTRRCRVRFAA